MPRALENELAQTPATLLIPPQVPLGVPGDLVRRRPDLRESEARLHEATARTGVAVAQFYPSITLSANFGTESLKAQSLFNWSSRTFTVGPTIDIPIFEGGQLRGMLHLREAQQREAALVYQKSVLQAWHEVDNALVAYGEAQQRRDDVDVTVRNDELALRVAEDRHERGAGNLLDVLFAQMSLAQQQFALEQAQTEVQVDLVTLYKALGGGGRQCNEYTSNGVFASTCGADPDTHVGI